jgi:hypothetical protein
MRKEILVWTFRPSTMILSALFVLVGINVGLYAQEIEERRGLDKPDSEKTEYEREFDKQISDYVLGERLILPADNMMRGEDAPVIVQLAPIFVGGLTRTILPGSGGPEPQTTGAVPQL